MGGAYKAGSIVGDQGSGSSVSDDRCAGADRAYRQGLTHLKPVLKSRRRHKLADVSQSLEEKEELGETVMDREKIIKASSE